MTFLQPIYFWGFLGLLAPIAIHLLSRNAKKTIPFGSLRFLTETKTRSMKSVMPTQWLLLLLRGVVLSLLVILLASPQMRLDQTVSKRLYLVDRAFENSPWISAYLDTIPKDAEVRWLADGFPKYTEQQPSIGTDYFYLLANPPVTATSYHVISPLLRKDFKGSKRSFPVQYEWVVPPADTFSNALVKVKKDNKYVQVIASFDEWNTDYQEEVAQNGEELVITYAFFTEEKYLPIQQILEAAISTLQRLSILTFREEENAESAKWLFWLSTTEPPARNNLVALESEMLKDWREITTTSFRLPEDLTLSRAAAMGLPSRLISAMARNLLDDEGVLTVDPATFDYQAMSSIGGPNFQPIDAHVLILMLLLLGLERWVSYQTSKA